jgi:hypothetical protein
VREVELSHKLPLSPTTNTCNHKHMPTSPERSCTASFSANCYCTASFSAKFYCFQVNDFKSISLSRRVKYTNTRSLERAHTHTTTSSLTRARTNTHLLHPPPLTPTPTPTHSLTHAHTHTHTQVKEAEQKLLRMEESSLVKSVRVRWRESDKPSWSPAVSWLHQVSLSPPPPSPLSISWSSPAVSCLGRRLHQVCLCRSLSDSTRVCPHRVCADSRVCACHGMVMWAYRYVKYFKATCICQQV